MSGRKQLYSEACPFEVMTYEPGNIRVVFYDEYARFHADIVTVAGMQNLVFPAQFHQTVTKLKRGRELRAARPIAEQRNRHAGHSLLDTHL